MELESRMWISIPEFALKYGHKQKSEENWAYYTTKTTSSQCNIRNNSCDHDFSIAALVFWVLVFVSTIQNCLRSDIDLSFSWASLQLQPHYLISWPLLTFHARSPLRKSFHGSFFDVHAIFVVLLHTGCLNNVRQRLTTCEGSSSKLSLDQPRAPDSLVRCYCSHEFLIMPVW